MANFKFGRLILNAQIGNRNLPVYDIESVPLGDLVFALWLVFIGAEQGEVPVEIPFQFVVEDDA